MSQEGFRPIGEQCEQIILQRPCASNFTALRRRFSTSYADIKACSTTPRRPGEPRSCFDIQSGQGYTTTVSRYFSSPPLRGFSRLKCQMGANRSSNPTLALATAPFVQRHTYCILRTCHLSNRHAEKNTIYCAEVATIGCCGEERSFYEHEDE